MSEELQRVDAADVAQLTKTSVDDLATALRANAYTFSFEESAVIETAKELVAIHDASEYQRGLDLMETLADMETRVTAWYNRFDKPLNFLVSVVRDLKRPQIQDIEPERKRIGGLLGTWKLQEEKRQQAERERQRQEIEAQLRAEAEAKAKALEQLAAQEALANPSLAQSFHVEAQAVREAPLPTVEIPEAAPATKRAGSFSKSSWVCEYVDLKELLRAFVDGRCFLDEDAIKDALQTYLDKQATALGPTFSKAFPGTRAVVKPYVGTRKRRT